MTVVESIRAGARFMARRWGIGPVFARELVTGARRWQVYAVRAAFASALLAWLWMIWTRNGSQEFRGANELAAIGQEFFVGLMVIQLVLVLLAAPAATAGAICVDKARGTLMHVLVTDLTSGEIVRGKLAARLAPILGLIACSLPVLAICSLFGGLSPAGVIGAYLVTAGVAIVGCTLALTLSVWARKTHQALLGTYAFLGLWIGSFFAVVAVFPWTGPSSLWHPATPLLYINPFALIIIPVQGSSPFEMGLPHQAAFLASAILASVGLLLLARRSIRPAALAQANRPAKRGAPEAPARLVMRLPAPPLDGNPVLWREWHRKLPSRWTGRFWAAYIAISTLASLLAIGPVYFLRADYEMAQSLAPQVNAWGVSIGLLLLCVAAASALSEERDRGSLDIIMATPLPTSTIIWGKWWGTFAMVPRLLILPIWVSVGLAMVSGHVLAVVLVIGLILACAAAIVSVGLALSTWIPRQGRVVTTIIIVYVMVSVGWPILLESLGISQELWPLPALKPRGEARQPVPRHPGRDGPVGPPRPRHERVRDGVLRPKPGRCGVWLDLRLDRHLRRDRRDLRPRHPPDVRPLPGTRLRNPEVAAPAHGPETGPGPPRRRSAGGGREYPDARARPCLLDDSEPGRPPPMSRTTFAAILTLGATVSALAGATDPAPAADESTRTLGILDARDEGAIKLDVRGKGGEKVRVVMRNTSKTRLNVIFPPGLVAAAAAGQLQSMGLGDPDNRAGAFGSFAHIAKAEAEPYSESAPPRSKGVALPPGKLVELIVPAVCLAYGDPTPPESAVFTLMDVDDFTPDPAARRALRTLATVGTSHGVAQALAWHAFNGLTFEDLASQEAYRINPQELALAAGLAHRLETTTGAELDLTRDRLTVQIKGEGPLADLADRLETGLEGRILLGLPARVAGDVAAPLDPALRLVVALSKAPSGDLRGRVAVRYSPGNGGRWTALGNAPLDLALDADTLDAPALATALDHAVAAAFVSVRPTPSRRRPDDPPGQQPPPVHPLSRDRQGGATPPSRCPRWASDPATTRTPRSRRQKRRSIA